MNKTLQRIDLQKYLPFFSPCSEKDNALAIYSTFGTQLLLECSKNSKPIEKLLQLINSFQLNWDLFYAETSILLDHKGVFQITPLTFGSNEQRYWLAGIQQESISNEKKILTTKSLNHIAQCLQQDYLQSESFTSLTEELAIRYEELNLLYAMDDADSYYKNQDQQESLKQLINNCIDYLNVDLAIIYLPELEICLHQSNSTIVIDKNILINRVCEQIYLYISKYPETLVVNNDKESDWVDKDLKIAYKFIATPIIKSNQHLNGILLITNESHKPDFSSSDRKLAEILAAEASKITQSRKDNITGQLNRRGITEKLDNAINKIKTNSQQHCLLLVNIDQFKVINETSSQAGGDKLLKQVNSIIQKNLKSTDDLGRLGADEFAAIIYNCNITDATGIADIIRLLIKKYRHYYQDKLFDISACIGVVDLSMEIDNYSAALRSADLACKVAKEAGGNRVHVFEKNDINLVTHENQMQWVSRINIGLEENRFQIFRQKIQPLQETEELEHYEILLRLKDINGNIISPFQFIPAAERYNLMTKLDKWVVKTTLEKLALIKKTQPENYFSCSINLSGQSFCEAGFSNFILDQVEKSGLPAEDLCFEITETAAVSNLAQAVEFIKKIKAIGCRFSLDDFGSGMSSFTYLKNLPIDYLKIDGYFVKTLLENKIDKAMVMSIHQIGNVMGLKTIAEFVENETILEELRKMGIDYGQGYGIGKSEPF